jgi:hypothetical protein
LTLPEVPVAPVAPVAPAGTVKLKIAAVPVPVFVTIAELPGAPVVVVPILTEAAIPWFPCGP